MRRAYHAICLPDGTLHQGPVVVETDAEGHLLGWHDLLEEEPFTEWVGGTFLPPTKRTDASHRSSL